MSLQLVDFEDTGVAGGGGGSGFSDLGSGNQVLVGFAVWSDAWIDAIAPIFSELNIADWGGRDVGQKYGGNHGFQVNLLPPGPGYAVVALTVRYDWYVDSIVVTWRRFAGGVPGGDFQTQKIGGTSGAHTTMLKLQDNWIAVGIQGRSGIFLDAIGLKGARPAVL